MARPGMYTKELGNAICAQLSLGKSLRTVCLAENMPSLQTIYNWFQTYPEFLEQYTRAKQESSDAMAEEIIDIADDGSNDWLETRYGKMVDKEAVMRSNLRVETRKWLMAKMKPKKYGDKLDLTTLGEKLPTPILSGASVAPLPKPEQK